MLSNVAAIAFFQEDISIDEPIEQPKTTMLEGEMNETSIFSNKERDASLGLSP